MNKNTELELLHIQLELHNNRTQHLRHFIDQYFCYQYGYVTNSGKSNWNLIFWREWVSVNANNLTNKTHVIKEHIVPLKFITNQLKNLKQDCTIAEIKTILDYYLHFATITKDEDTKLRKMGLNQKMPEDFFNAKSELFNDVFARYKKANIEIKKHGKI
jgi:hypothetical protein